jgi:mycofactocin precursor
MTQIVSDRADATTDRAAETEPSVGAPPPESPVVESVLEDELVEDVSIDGMCGVY